MGAPIVFQRDWYDEMVTRVKRATEQVAETLAPSQLHCEECGKKMPVSRGKATDYLYRGWPKHCGVIMVLIPKFRLDPDH